MWPPRVYLGSHGHPDCFEKIALKSFGNQWLLSSLVVDWYTYQSCASDIYIMNRWHWPRLKRTTEYGVTCWERNQYASALRQIQGSKLGHLFPSLDRPSAPLEILTAPFWKFDGVPSVASFPPPPPSPRMSFSSPTRELGAHLISFAVQ